MCLLQTEQKGSNNPETGDSSFTDFTEFFFPSKFFSL